MTGYSIVTAPHSRNEIALEIRQKEWSLFLFLGSKTMITDSVATRIFSHLLKRKAFFGLRSSFLPSVYGERSKAKDS